MFTIRLHWFYTVYLRVLSSDDVLNSSNPFHRVLSIRCEMLTVAKKNHWTKIETTFFLPSLFLLKAEVIVLPNVTFIRHSGDASGLNLMAIARRWRSNGIHWSRSIDCTHFSFIDGWLMAELWTDPAWVARITTRTVRDSIPVRALHIPIW